jgi:MtN3 and saliva related transmembrane protein
MKTSAIDLIGYAGALCNTISFVPQLLRVIKLRSAREISYSMFLIFAAGSALWLIYGVYVHSFPVAISNSVTLLLSFSIFLLKVRYDRPRRTEDTCLPCGGGKR